MTPYLLSFVCVLLAASPVWLGIGVCLSPSSPVPVMSHLVTIQTPLLVSLALIAFAPGVRPADHGAKRAAGIALGTMALAGPGLILWNADTWMSVNYGVAQGLREGGGTDYGGSWVPWRTSVHGLSIKDVDLYRDGGRIYATVRLPDSAWVPVPCVLEGERGQKVFVDEVRPGVVRLSASHRWAITLDWTKTWPVVVEGGLTAGVREEQTRVRFQWFCREAGLAVLAITPFLASVWVTLAALRATRASRAIGSGRQWTGWRVVLAIQLIALIASAMYALMLVEVNTWKYFGMTPIIRRDEFGLSFLIVGMFAGFALVAAMLLWSGMLLTIPFRRTARVAWLGLPESA